MTPRHRRIYWVLAILVGVSLAGGLALRAFRDNVMFYFDPTKVAAGEVPVGKRFRLGGMVEKGSVLRSAGTMDVQFVVTDFHHTLPVKYSGVLPDLFREGAGVVAHGRLDDKGVFQADEVLAKHDEKYMPPEVAKSLAQGAAAARAEGVPAPATTGRH